MRKLDQRGVAAFEFCLVFLPFLASMFVIFDFGRYAITVQSLRALANAGARATMVGEENNTCYTDAAINRTTPACSGDPMSDDAKKAVAPFLYNGGLSPTLNVTSGASAVTVTASEPGFTMGMTPLTQSLWPASFNNPSVSTQIPVPASSS